MNNKEAAQAPHTGHGTPIPSDTTHWLEALVPADLTCEHEGNEIPVNEHPSLQKYKDASEMVKAFIHSQNLIGKKAVGLLPLSDDATDQDRAHFESELRKILQVPQTADEYEIDMPEGMEPDEILLPWFKSCAHEVGISPKQAQELSDRYNQLLHDLSVDARNNQQKQYEQTMESMRSFWGTKTKANAQTAKRGFVQTALAAGLSSQECEDIFSNYRHYPQMLRIFYEVGKNQVEDGFVQSNGGPQSNAAAMTMQQFFADKVFGGKEE